MLKKCFVVMVSLCLAAVLAAGSGFAADEVKVGIMIPTTGGTATDGKDMESAIKLAVDEINAAGGLLGKRSSPLPVMMPVTRSKLLLLPAN
jgi:branched-chain amino acid transport system substrate-binding protein